ncbi:rhamnan synthesis F family protein [Yersinia enterocolitica]
MDLLSYFSMIKLKQQVNKDRVRVDFLYNHPFRFICISLIKPFRRIYRFIKYQKLSNLVLSQKPAGKYNSSGFIDISKLDKNNNIYSINLLLSEKNKHVSNDGAFELNKIKPNTDNKKLIIVHAFYQREAEEIFNRLVAFTDYDIVITSPYNNIICKAKEILGQERVIGFIMPNYGRDILPFLICLQLIVIEKYEYFVKVHTKRSQHLNDNGAWFNNNLDYLVGNKNATDGLFSIMSDDEPQIYGEYILPIQDHIANNIHWLTYLLEKEPASVEASFIPGTMFIGNRAFLVLIRDLQLHLFQIEKENGQLDGCYVHAIERYFGYIASVNGGKCCSIETLIMNGMFHK